MESWHEFQGGKGIMSLKQTCVAAAACLLAVSLSAPEGAAQQRAAPAGPIGLMCTWIAFNAEKETFLVDADSRSVYWSSQNRGTQTQQFNAGRIVFDSIRDRLTLGPGRVAQDVQMRFTIDRITGDLSVAFGGEVAEYMRENAREPIGRCVVRRTF